MQMRDYVAKYDSLASEDAWFNIPLRKEYLLSQVGRGKKVLDVGCLGGKISRLMMDQNNEVWGLEANSAAADIARKRGVAVRVANVEDGIPFEDSFFDVVHAGEVIEYLYDTKHFFQECWRVLKKQGLLLFTVPNLNSLENRFKVVTGKYLTGVGAYPEDHFGESVRVFNLDKARELIHQTGFEWVEARGIPVLVSRGKWLDAPLGWVGKVLPGISKLLMVSVRKI